jgi:hypothetical protein
MAFNLVFFIIFLASMGVIAYTQHQQHRLTRRVLDRGQASAAYTFAAVSILSRHDPHTARALMDHYSTRMQQVDRGEYTPPKSPEAAVAEVERIIAQVNPGGVHN